MPAYQGGASCELFTAAGSKPLEAVKISGVSSKSAVRCQYDKGLRAACVCINGEQAPQCRIQLPAHRGLLGLQHPIIAFQILAPEGAPLYFEFDCSSGQGRRRIVLSTAQRDLARDPLHAKLPLRGVRRNVWLNLCLDVAGIHAASFQGQELKCVDRIHIGPSCRLRRVVTLRDAPGVDLVPALDFPTGVHSELQLIGFDEIRAPPSPKSLPSPAPSSVAGPSPQMPLQLQGVGLLRHRQPSDARSRAAAAAARPAAEVAVGAVRRKAKPAPTCEQSGAPRAVGSPMPEGQKQPVIAPPRLAAEAAVRYVADVDDDDVPSQPPPPAQCAAAAEVLADHVPRRGSPGLLRRARMPADMQPLCASAASSAKRYQASDYESGPSAAAAGYNAADYESEGVSPPPQHALRGSPASSRRQRQQLQQVGASIDSSAMGASPPPSSPQPVRGLSASSSHSLSPVKSLSPCSVRRRRSPPSGEVALPVAGGGARRWEELAARAREELSPPPAEQYGYPIAADDENPADQSQRDDSEVTHRYSGGEGSEPEADEPIPNVEWQPDDGDDSDDATMHAEADESELSPIRVRGFRFSSSTLREYATVTDAASVRATTRGSFVGSSVASLTQPKAGSQPQQQPSEPGRVLPVLATPLGPVGPARVEVAVASAECQPPPAPSPPREATVGVVAAGCRARAGAAAALLEDDGLPSGFTATGPLLSTLPSSCSGLRVRGFAFEESTLREYSSDASASPAPASPGQRRLPDVVPSEARGTERRRLCFSDDTADSLCASRNPARSAASQQRSPAAQRWREPSGKLRGSDCCDVLIETPLSGGGRDPAVQSAWSCASAGTARVNAAAEPDKQRGGLQRFIQAVTGRPGPEPASTALPPQRAQQPPPDRRDLLYDSMLRYYYDPRTNEYFDDADFPAQP
eukprot:TRINITY_DN1826_c0_g1_i1.p1 TRINITY_DN1826_c0_g1~~TRINITY_DN1826_c0_g1_i1.p1  ORF type:complete len:942 (+),score=216.47 TRINITY_DN1826_c0_g1_i1:71-2827(+)